MLNPHPFDRRHFHAQALTAAAMAWQGLAKTDRSAHLLAAESGQRPGVAGGVMSGDVTERSAVIWSRSDRPGRMWVEVAATEEFKNPRRFPGPETLVANDLTAKVQLTGLPEGESLCYRVQFEDLDFPGKFGAPAVGHLRTAQSVNTAAKRDVSFVWSGDVAGQGFGIDPARGGMIGFEAVRKLQPDFFVHCGDHIYADNPIPSEIQLPDGTIWKNLTTPETSKVAETIDEFRGRYRYNLLDDHYRRFHAEIPVISLWDDHEVLNNWYPGEQLTKDMRYSVKSASLLSTYARRAFFDYMPIAETSVAPGRIFRKVSYGPLLEMFCLDMRSFRGPNDTNRQTTATDYLGRRQVQWLKKQLAASNATWKVICADMPIGLVVPDDVDHFEALANADDGPPLGRELELADLLRSMKQSQVRNVIWITADVHYAASNYYDPATAAFSEFDGFWEFVSGPLHAVTFGPQKLDKTFGLQTKFSVRDTIPPGTHAPSEGYQYFGHVQINAQTKVLTVTHYNIAGENLWSIVLPPQM